MIHESDCRRFIAFLHHYKCRRVCLEAGHIYADQMAELEHTVGVTIAVEVERRLRAEGFEVTRMLFIDDYNATSRTLNEDAYVQYLSDCGFRPDVCVHESGLEKAAQSLIEKLEVLGKVGRHKNGRRFLDVSKRVDKEGNGLIELDGSERPIACAVLDAALCLRKTQEFGVSVTILPARWKSQQKKTRRLLRALDEDIPTVTIYFRPNGELTVGLSNEIRLKRCKDTI